MLVKDNLLQLLASKQLPIKTIARYPYPIEESLGHWSIPGTSPPDIKNIIIFSIMTDNILIEYYTNDLKVDSTKLPAIHELLNHRNANYILKLAVSQTCSLRITANIWIDSDWEDLVQQAVLLLGISTFTGILEGCAHEIKQIATQHGPLQCMNTEQPEVPHYAKNYLKYFLNQKEILSQLIHIDNSISVEFDGKYFEDSVHIKYRCMIQLTPQAALFSFSNEDLHSAMRQDLELLKCICKISTSLGVAQVNLPHTSIESKMKYSYIHPIEFNKVFSMHYETTLQEFKTFINEFNKLSFAEFEGGTNFIAMNQPYLKAIDYSDIESNSEEGPADVFTHFKNYQLTTDLQIENEIIESLKRAGLAQNFGLPGDSYNSDTTLLHFHAPNSEALEEIGVHLTDLKVFMGCLERFLNKLKAERLTFYDLTKQKLFWDKAQIEQGQVGIQVYCDSYLHQILEVFGPERQVNTLQQIQDFLLSKTISAQHKEGTVAEDEVEIKEDTRAEEEEKTEELEDMAEVRLSCEIEEKFYVRPIDEVSKAVIHYRDVSKLTAYEIKLLCDCFYRAYQVNRHPFILTCYGYNYKTNKKAIYFAYEHCNTDLHSFITRGHRLPDSRQFLRDVASALGYLSSKPPMKVAISPKCILLSSKLSPKLMPFCFKESKDTKYLPPYNPVSVDWGKFLAYSFGLIAVFVLTGKDIEYQETDTIQSYPIRSMPESMLAGNESQETDTLKSYPKRRMPESMLAGDESQETDKLKSYRFLRIPLLEDSQDLFSLMQLCFDSEEPDFKAIMQMLERRNLRLSSDSSDIQLPTKKIYRKKQAISSPPHSSSLA
jgi:hypothetical protein